MLLFVLALVNATMMSYGIAKRNMEPGLYTPISHQYSVHNSQKDHREGEILEPGVPSIFPRETLPPIIDESTTEYYPDFLNV